MRFFNQLTNPECLVILNGKTGRKMAETTKIYHIRKARSGDEVAIAALVEKYLGYIYQDKMPSNILDKKDIRVYHQDYYKSLLPTFYIALDSRNKIIGCCGFEQSDKTDKYQIGYTHYFEISAIVVNKQYRGLSIGSQLLKACLDDFSGDILCEAWGYKEPYANAHYPLIKNGFKIIKDMGSDYYIKNGDCPFCSMGGVKMPAHALDVSPTFTI